MTAIVSTNFRLRNAKDFLETIASGGDRLYAFIGKNTPWDGGDVPPLPGDSINETFYELWRDMLGAKRISSGEISYVIPRYNWISGVSWDHYDDRDGLIFTKQFFVFTDDNRVYLCLNRPAGSLSTIKPTLTTNDPFRLADGFLWKFMFSVPLSARTKFMTENFIPVTSYLTNPSDGAEGSQQFAIQQAAIPGGVYSVIVDNSGTGYTTAPGVSVVSGDGTDFAAVAVLSGDQVIRIDVLNPGTGYTFLNLSLVGGGGTGGLVRASIPPIGGHGSDPINELGGFYTCINARFEYSENNTLPTRTSYRKVGLLFNPLAFGTVDLATATNIRQTTRLTVTGLVGTFFPGDKIVQPGSNSSANVVEYDSGNFYLYVNDVVGTFTTGAISTEIAPIASASVTAIEEGGFVIRSGSLLYIEYADAQTRSLSQIEDYKIVFEF